MALRKWNRNKETTVCIDLKPVVIIECKTKDAEPTLWWNEPNLAAVSTTKQAIIENYQATQQSFREARASQWSK